MVPNPARNDLTESELAPPSLAELFHENSKQRRHHHAFYRRIASVNGNPAIHAIMSSTFRSYPGASTVALPEPVPRPVLDFDETVMQRRSIRHFSGEPLQLEDLSRLLRLGHGITGVLASPDEATRQPVRAAPSGGAIFPVELFPIVTAVDGVEAGVYHYHPARNVLELVRRGNQIDALGEATSDPSTFQHAGVTIALAASFGKTSFKYGERGYRFVLLEAGHVAQNLLLAATSAGLGAVAIGGFLDDDLNSLTGLDGVDEAVLYMVVIGKTPSSETQST